MNMAGSSGDKGYKLKISERDFLIMQELPFYAPNIFHEVITIYLLRYCFWI